MAVLQHWEIRQRARVNFAKHRPAPHSLSAETPSSPAPHSAYTFARQRSRVPAPHRDSPYPAAHNRSASLRESAGRRFHKTGRRLLHVPPKPPSPGIRPPDLPHQFPPQPSTLSKSRIANPVPAPSATPPLWPFPHRLERPALRLCSPARGDTRPAAE